MPLKLLYAPSAIVGVLVRDLLKTIAQLLASKLALVASASSRAIAPVASITLNLAQK